MSKINPLLSIIIPVYNEIKFIEQVFNSILKSEFIDKEVFFVDGMSNDGTYEWLKLSIKELPNYFLFKNEKRFVSYGFNMVYKKTKGKYICRLEGHSLYPPKNFTKAVKLLENNDADVVGGPALHVGKTRKGRIIAKCMSSPFGVGMSYFRISSRKKIVDTVPFPIYKRLVLDDVGTYDEQLIRNQDDELNYRCTSMGYKILMHPDLKTEYFVREKLTDLWIQYFQYGLFKPLVLKKVPKSGRFYQFLPFLFVLSNLIFFSLTFLNWIFITPVFLYLTMAIIFSLRIQRSLFDSIFSVAVFPCLHISYGLGFIFGIKKLKNNDDSKKK